jgi:hypothetical protein
MVYALIAVSGMQNLIKFFVLNALKIAENAVKNGVRL